MKNMFEYNALPARVIFGYDTLKFVTEEAQKLGMKRVIVLTTKGSERKGLDLADRLGSLCAGTFSDAAMHTPVDVTNAAMAKYVALGADGTVAIGGGSTVGLGKAIALRTDCPQIAIPTTYAGSEMTPYLGQTENGVKKTLSSAKVLPETVIYDVGLTHSLPTRLAAASGVNAIAHSAEALYARTTNPVVKLMAAEGISSLRDALPRIVADGDDRKGRYGALYGAWLCSLVSSQVPMALHHKLCHAIGGSFSLPHSDIHANVLPHVISYNSRAAEEAVGILAEAIRCDDAAEGLYEFNQMLGIHASLRDLGMPEDGIDVIVKQTMTAPYWNPRSMDRLALRNLLTRAWAGDPPRFEHDL